MQCKIEGCGSVADYKAAQLCQKHYFRQWRNGHTELKAELKRAKFGFSRQPRIVMPGRGYIRVYAPSHPLADSAGYVAENRKVVFDRYGHSLPPCEICGKPMSWGSDIHIDHRDDDVSNNHQDNLRPLCRGCNVWRSYPEQHTISGHYAITIDGVTKTPTEWAREPGAQTCGAHIWRRKLAGMSDYDAVFSANKTHPKKSKAKAALRELKSKAN